MNRRQEFDSSWQEVSISAHNTPPPADMIARQAASIQQYTRADSSFEHIDESIMVINSAATSMVTSPDSQPSIRVPVEETPSPSLVLINAKLDLYLTQIDRFLSSTEPGQNNKSYLSKLRGEVEGLKKTASNYLANEKPDPTKAALVKSNLAYDIGKLDELMNNLYLNHSEPTSTTASCTQSMLLTSSSPSLVNDDSQQAMTLSSSIDVLSLVSDFQRASMIQEKVLEQNRLLKEMMKTLSLQPKVSGATEAQKPAVVGQTQPIPIDPTSNEAEDLGFVTSFTPGSSPSEFSMMTGPSNHPNISLTTSFISLKNKLFGKKSKSKDSQDEAKSSRSNSSSASMTTSQSCTINCLDANSSVNTGNTFFGDEEESIHTLSAEATVSKPEVAPQTSVTSQSETDVQRKALNLFYSCPKCNTTIYKDETTFEKYTEHIRTCYFPNHSCFFCWKLFEPGQSEAFQKHVHDHLDQANEDGFITF